MVQQNTVAYILSQMRQGKSLEEINAFLIDAGYDKQEVESSIQYVINLEKNPRVAEQQRIQQLADYMKQQVSRGYDMNVVSNFLISRGYPYYEVNSAINLIKSPKQEVKVEHKLAVIALITIIMVSVGLGIFFLANMGNSSLPSKLLDVSTNKLSTLVKAGSDLNFQVNVVNLGKVQRYDVVLSYEVIDKSSGRIVSHQSETVAISTSTQRVVSVPIPQNTKPGKYLLKATASYEEFNATSGFLFEVVGAEEAAALEKKVESLLPKEVETNASSNASFNGTKVLSNVSSLIPSVVPERPESVPAQETIVPKTDKDIFLAKSKADAIEYVKAVSVRDPNKAVSLCRLFAYESQQTECLTALARYKKDPAYCLNANETLSKDSCLIQIIMETKKTDSCSLITDPNIKFSCDMLASTESAKKKYMPADARARLNNVPQVNFAVPFNS